MDGEGRIGSGRRVEIDSHAADAAILELARGQHGVVAHRQLLDVGLSRSAIGRRLARQYFIALYRGVYAVGHDVLSQRARWMAAVLAGGPFAVLSHRSAAALWALAAYHGVPEVTVPGSQRHRSGIAFHRSALPPDERTVRDGIPVTTASRTLLDLARVVPVRKVERALNEAEVQRLTDSLSLHDLLSRYPGCRGARAVYAALGALQAGPSITRSELEERFLVFIGEIGLPRPLTNETAEGFEIDCLWRAERVAVELDSRTFHDTAIAYERDRERDRILNAAGWRPVRLTWRQLTQTPAEVERDLRKMLR